MRVNVSLQGVGRAKRQLERMGRRVDPVLRGALNTTATKTRTERYVKPLKSTLKGKLVRKAMVVKRARRGRMNSRIIPSGAGIPVTEYSNWGFDPIDKTRARIWIRGVNGKKIAAGFVNPSGKKKMPLQTLSRKTARGKTYAYARKLQVANGFSAAYWFKQLSGGATVSWASDFLQREFERRMKAEIEKALR